MWGRESFFLFWRGGEEINKIVVQVSKCLKKYLSNYQFFIPLILVAHFSCFPCTLYRCTSCTIFLLPPVHFIVAPPVQYSCFLPVHFIVARPVHFSCFPLFTLSLHLLYIFPASPCISSFIYLRSWGVLQMYI